MAAGARITYQSVTTHTQSDDARLASADTDAQAVAPVQSAFSDADRFALFVRLFAAFSIIHSFIGVRDWTAEDSVSIVGTFVALFAAAIVIAKPTAARVVLMAASLLVVEINMMPYTPNHVFVTSLICLALIVAAFLSRHGTPWTAVGASAVAPAVRLGVVIVYGFAVLHKLNTDYFDPSVSCGLYLYRQPKTFIPFLPTGDWVKWPTVLGSLYTEFALGLFLLFRRTRTAAIAGGLLFHAMLAFHVNGYVMSFSVLIIPFYSLFIPLTFYQRIADLFARAPGLIA